MRRDISVRFRAVLYVSRNLSPFSLFFHGLLTKIAQFGKGKFARKAKDQWTKDTKKAWLEFRKLN